MAEAVIVEAVRSPVGKRNGGLAGVHPADLSAQEINGLVQRAGLDPALVEAEHEAVGSAWGAAGSSFAFFASGAVIPVIPYLLGLSGPLAVVMASILVGAALLLTGAIVGLPERQRATRWRPGSERSVIGTCSS